MSAILTDLKKSRTVPDAEARLYEDLEWAGLEWDEGSILGAVDLQVRLLT